MQLRFSPIWPRAGALHCHPLRIAITNELPFLNIRFARDSAGTQTGQTRIVSCDRLVLTTIYAIWGLPINELYTSGPCRPLIRYPSEANLSVIFRSKVE